ncbi:hypothetical protein EAH87_04260 [Sphingomonas koreensis]|nr:hypothetical protein EAH87_04260 [Sphingomonas koreensis]
MTSDGGATLSKLLTEERAHFKEVGQALDRLIRIAMGGDNGNARRVADFLLAWADGRKFGHFEVLDIACIDPALGSDVLVILAYLSRYGALYDNAWGRRENIEEIVKKWRIDEI